MKVKTNIALVAVTLAAATGYGANIVMQGSEAQTSFDITNPASWGVEAISAEDRATITTNGDIRTEAYIGSDQTFQAWILDLQNNARLTASGSNSTIKNILGEEPMRNNTNIGTNIGSNVRVEILGSGNTYAIDVTARSLMLGNVDSTSGSNLIYVSSNAPNSRNTFSVSGVNSFIRLSKSADSGASNIVRIGDYTDATFAVTAWVGGSESSDLAGGKASIEMLGSNSTLTLKRDSFIGNNGGTQSGGSAKILVSGSGNTFNSVGTTIRMNGTMTGGSNSFEISGENNTVTWQNIQVGSASSTGGSAKISVEGSTHSISATGLLVVNGSEVTDSDGNVTAVNGGSVEFISDDVGFSTISVGRVVAFDGILSIDFSNIDIDAAGGDYLEFELIKANSDWTNIADKLISTSGDSENAHLNVITKNEEDTWELTYNGTSLWVAYTCVPEPSSFAAVFALGALVVAFARRRGK